MTTDTTPAADQATAIDPDRLEQFVGQVVTELAAVQAAATAYVGDQLGLYRAMAGAGELTSDELAERTGTNERLVREWLHTQVSGGYVSQHADTGAFSLPAEHAAVLADEDSAVYVAGMLEVAAATWAGTEKVADAFRGDGGLGWGEHDRRLFRGVERLFGPIYRNFLVQEWIPALDGVEEKLRNGATVADVGCGYGVSTLTMAKAFGASRFAGFDNHGPSIAAATQAAAAAGLDGQVQFKTLAADTIEGDGYDLVTFFDCLHDMGDPLGAAKKARSVLADDGTVLLVEPHAGDSLADNINPVSRLYYAGSVILCTPSSLSQQVGTGLGAQAGEQRLSELFAEAGFTRFRRASETPFNIVLEARP